MTDAIPLFPLGTVLFPGIVLPLHIFEPRYRALVAHLLALPSGTDREFGVVAIRRGAETGSHDDSTLYRIGCSAELRQVKTYTDGRYDLVTVGRRRFRLHAVDDTSAPYLRGEVEWLPDEPAGTASARRAERLAPSVLAAFRRYLRLLADASDGGSDGADPSGDQLPEDPAVLSHLVAASASLTVADRQRLLAAVDTATRLGTELALLRRETGLIAALRAVPAPLAEFEVPTNPN
ncbi:LON peptidase substrate-binding domain-containing protein [Actinocatenispora rupis]|uniref:Peptidase n=1 Tax=Actinocatenispora rupis TaxID=519421 RepID=A0A8J3IZL9_9ACTN|nr:LON peptidase substrate-binding domain-containing protein [Actinocatenispora rupis]GID09310.1 peptidase [Actinocatenispora rupis]